MGLIVEQVGNAPCLPVISPAPLQGTELLRMASLLLVKGYFTLLYRPQRETKHEFNIDKFLKHLQL